MMNIMITMMMSFDIMLLLLLMMMMMIATVSKSEVSFFSAISFWIFPTTCIIFLITLIVMLMLAMLTILSTTDFDLNLGYHSHAADAGDGDNGAVCCF